MNPKKDFVFCFLKERIIEETDCDMYEHNCECDNEINNKNMYHRTHRKGSRAACRYPDTKGDVLNSCEYCLEKDKLKCYTLPPEAVKLLNKNKKGLLSRIRG